MKLCVFLQTAVLRCTLLHRNINSHAENLLTILVIHLTLNGVGSHWRLDVKDSLLNNADLSRLLRAIKTVNIDVSAIQRKVDGRILTKTSLLFHHLHAHVRGSKLPYSTFSDSLVNLSISVHSCILFRNNRIIDDLHRVEVSVSRRSRANLPGDRTRRSENNLSKSKVLKPTATTKRAKINFMK